MGRKKSHAYNEEFRREAVKRASKPGVTQAQVAKELGVSAQQIANWKRQFTRLSDKQFNTLKESQIILIGSDLLTGSLRILKLGQTDSVRI